MINNNTPIVVGVGQFTEHLNSDDYLGLSPQELAAKASAAALADTLAGDTITKMIDTVAFVRTVGDSVPAPVKPFVAPFGGSDNPPRSVAQRIGVEPERAIYSHACGDEPQKLIGELSEEILAGRCKAALITGAEAIATQRKNQSEKNKLDWNESPEGQLEDRGRGTEKVRSRTMSVHQMEQPTAVYPVFEHARRKRLGLSREAYAKDIGELFSRFSQVAANNPYAMSPHALSATDIAETTDSNRMIADPHNKSMVARDWVNQAAAVVLTSVGEAKAMGIPEEKWVFLHGYADVDERPVLEREDLGASPAMVLAYKAAMQAAGVGIAQIRYLDIYSCFPIAVYAACDGLGLDHKSSIPLTATGGLPYFGGPGNNYSMHGIASVLEKLRADPGSYGMVGANGGYLSKHSVGVYSTTQVENWKPCSSVALQQQINALPAPAFAAEPAGEGVVESYTIVYGKKGAETAIVIGRLVQTGERFIANNVEGDSETLQLMIDNDPVNTPVYVRSLDIGNRFALSKESLERLLP